MIEINREYCTSSKLQRESKHLPRRYDFSKTDKTPTQNHDYNSPWHLSCQNDWHFAMAT